jgi:hypothetical protein
MLTDDTDKRHAGDIITPPEAEAAPADVAAGASVAEMETQHEEPHRTEPAGAAPDAAQIVPQDSSPFVQHPTILDELLDSDEVLQESEIEKRLLMINKRMPKCAHPAKSKILPASFTVAQCW